MTNYETLKELEEQNKEEIIVFDNEGLSYIINSTEKGEVALFNIEFDDATHDKVISQSDFNKNYRY